MFVDPCIIVQFINKNPTRCNSVSKFTIPYLYETQHVSGDTPPIIRSLKLHWQPLVCIILWKVVGRVVVGRCQAEYTLPDSVHQPQAFGVTSVSNHCNYCNHTNPDVTQSQPNLYCSYGNPTTVAIKGVHSITYLQVKGKVIPLQA
jgi:hypothetical protein